MFTVDSPISQYVRNIHSDELGAQDLLTIAEEQKLAKIVQSKRSTSTAREAARQRMIKCNLRLVVKIAHEYENYGVPLIDLVNEGNIGLMKAIDRYKPGTGAKISSYASWWIKQAIRRALADQAKTIRLPVHVGDKLAKLRQLSREYYEHFGRDATDEELSMEMGMSEARIQALRATGKSTVPLDAELGDTNQTVAEMIKDDRAPDPCDQFDRKVYSELLHKLLQGLPKKQAEILKDRYGFGSGETKTLEEIGKKHNVTRERIRQIQNQALFKLRKQLLERNW